MRYGTIAFTATRTIGDKHPRADLARARALSDVSCDLENLHDLVSEVIDDFHGDAARLRLRERPRRVAVQRGPCVRVDLRLERGIERAVRIVLAKEVGVANEEALLVVVGVDEPAGALPVR